MKAFIVMNYDSEDLFFSTRKKAQKCEGDIRIVYLDIDSLPFEGCTREDIKMWSDDIDLWIIE